MIEDRETNVVDNLSLEIFVDISDFFDFNRTSWHVTRRIIHLQNVDDVIFFFFEAVCVRCALAALLNIKVYE